MYEQEHVSSLKYYIQPLVNSTINARGSKLNVFKELFNVFFSESIYLLELVCLWRLEIFNDVLYY